MPRLDNTTETVIEEFGLLNVNDPDPVDLCWFCYEADGWECKEYDIDHPSYEDGVCSCHICGRKLTVEDD